ncbi:MAG: rhodanese-like domain-containing protein [Chloroflexota bacterium]
MKAITHTLYVCLAAILVVGAVFAIGCTAEPVTTTHIITTTETITTTTITFQTTESITVTEANAMIQANLDNPEFVFLDIRTPKERAVSYIEGSILLDWNGGVFAAEVESLDRCTTYLLYCKSGVRSASAMELMRSLNFAEVYNMLGGITDWEAAGYPVVVPVIPPTTTTPTIITTTTTNNQPTDCLVLELILPSSTVEGDIPFNISLVVTNTGNSQVSCDIPIIVTDVTEVDNPVYTKTLVISVTLGPGETKQVDFYGASLPGGNYMFQAGDISKTIPVLPG